VLRTPSACASYYAIQWHVEATCVLDVHMTLCFE
jgi:hypothetical protein